MSENIEVKNDGKYKIELQTWDNQFIVSKIDEETKDCAELKKFPKYDDAEEYIENREKRIQSSKIKKKEPLFALKKEYSGEEYQKIKITSLVGKACWIVRIEDNKRLKEYSTDNFTKDTEDNKQKIKEVNELRNKADEIEESIIGFTEDEIKDYFGNVD